RVCLLQSWSDDEIGVRCMGRLLEESDIAVARSVGTTGYTPEDYRQYGRENYEANLRAAHDFNPAIVYFCEDDFAPDAKPSPKMASGQKEEAHDSTTTDGESPIDGTKSCFNCRNHRPVAG